MKTTTLILTLLASVQVFANMPDAPNTPLQHCYHWLKEEDQNRKVLTFKYEFAKKNKGEFSFYSTKEGGAMAGDGIYCAKTLTQSTSYGDRVVRIEFVPDAVFRDQVGNNICSGLVSAADCRAKTPDVINYEPSRGWYVIKNPEVIATWSANSPELVKDLAAINKVAGNEYAGKFNALITKIQQEISARQSTVFHSPKARRPLLEMLQNDTYLESAASPSLLKGLAGYPTQTLPNSKKIIYAGKILNTILTTGQSFDVMALNESLESIPGGQNLLKEKLRTALQKSKAELKPEIIMSAMKLDPKLVSAGQLKDYLKTLISAAGSNFDGLTDQFSGDANFMKALFLSMPEAKQAANMVSVSKVYVWLKYFSEQTDLPTSQVKPYAVAFLTKVVLDYTSADKAPRYNFPTGNLDSLKSPFMTEAFTTVAKSDEVLKTDADYLRLWEMITYFEKRAGADGVANLKAKLDSPSTNSKTRPRELIQRLYSNRSRPLDESIESKMLAKMIAMEVASCQAGKRCEILELMTEDVNNYFRNAYSSREGQRKAYFFFDELTKSLVHDGQTGVAWYAYEMMSRTSLGTNVSSLASFETFYGRFFYGQFDAEAIERMKKMVRTSFDGQLVKVLVSKITPAPGVLGGEPQTRLLLTEVVDSVVSGEFETYRNSADFKWTDTVRGAYRGSLSGSTEFGSNACEFVKALQANEKGIAKFVRTDAAAFSAALRQNAAACN